MDSRATYVAVTVLSESPEIIYSVFTSYEVEGIEELASGLKGYWPKTIWDNIRGEVIQKLKRENFDFSIENIPYQNWNKEWEASFAPIYVNNFCCIRAPFHSLRKKVVHDIIIEPKMAFGTGHHATTYLLIHKMSKMDFHNKKVLDYGTGTGVLAILAAKMKATSVWAIDNDISAYENTLENSSINNCPGLKVFHSTIEMIEENAVFDIILANINRNTLLNSVLEITKKAALGAQLVMSGFYENDLRDIQKTFEKDWSYETHSVREGWCCVILKKKYS